MSNRLKLTRPVAGAIRPVVDLLEGRQMLTSTPWNLATQGPLTQNWEGIDFLSSNVWTPAPSIEGFTYYRNPNVLNGNLGPGTPGAGVLQEPALTQPATSANGTRSYRLIVNSNVTTPGGATSGFSDGAPREMQYTAGAEVTGTTAAGKSVTTGLRTIALQSSDSWDDNYLKIYIDNSGKTSAVRVRYDLLDVDNDGASATGTVRQTFALQYRVGGTGDYQYVDESLILNAADFTAGAVGLANSVDVVLPADTIGAALVELRIYTVNTSGTDQLVAIENINVSNADTPGSISFAGATVNVNEADGTGSVTVRRRIGSVGAVSASYSITDINATNGTDYTLAAGVVNFANGQDTATITFPITTDTIAEGPERFRLTLSNATGGAEIGLVNASTTVTIIDNDSTAPVAGTVLINEILINPSDDDEPGEYIEIRGTPGASLKDVQLIAIEGDRTNSTATTAGVVDYVFELSDYTIGSNGILIIKSDLPTYNIPAGTTIVTSTLFNTEAGIIENGSNTWALVYNPVPYIVGTDLHDDAVDAPAVLNVTAGTTIVDMVGFYDTIENSGTNDRVWGAIVYGFGTTSVTDVLDGVTRFPTDNTAYTSVTPVPNAAAWYGGNIIDPDPVDAGTTDFRGIAYTNVAGQFTANKPAGAVITPGDSNYPGAANPGQVSFGPTRYTVNEDAGIATITVYRAGGTAGTVSVAYTTLTTPGTATPNADYTPVSGVLTFGPGETEKTFNVPIIDDSEAEGAETIELGLSNPTGGVGIIAPGTARITINKSDPVQPVGLLINEMLTNPVGAETPAEFLELRGAPNTTLVDVYLLVVEGDSAAQGVMDFVINLTGAKIGSNGLLLIGSNLANEGHQPQDPNTGFFGIAAYNSNGAGFESGTNSFLLVYAPPIDPPIAIPVAGTDYDSGTSAGRSTLNIDPALVVLDSFAYFDGGVEDRWYTDTVLTVPPGSGTTDSSFFGGISRLNGDNRANVNTTTDPSPFYYAIVVADPNLPVGTAPNMSLLYASTGRSTNFPAGATHLTPGATNQPAPDNIAPTVTSVTFNPLVSQKLVVVFSEDVRNTTNGVVAADFTLTNSVTSSTVNLVVDSVSSDGKTVTLSFANTGGLTDAILVDGNYVLKVKQGQIADLAGNTLAADSNNPFKFKNADATGDYIVEFADLLIVAQNYGTLTGMTYATGDFNYDGATDFADLLALAQRYGSGLPAAMAAFNQLTNPKPLATKQPVVASSRKTSFGSTIIS